MAVVASLFVTVRAGRADTQRLAHQQRLACERGNAIRAVLSVLTQSQMQDLLSASLYGATPAVRSEYRRLLDQTREVIADAAISKQLVQQDC